MDHSQKSEECLLSAKPTDTLVLDFEFSSLRMSLPEVTDELGGSISLASETVHIS